MFKVAISAGHYLNTPGKRIPKSLDPNQTREWVLNDRVVRGVMERLKEYDDVDVLRVDDPTGKTDVSLKARTDKANKWGADIYIAVHHNAGGGRGIVVYVYINVDADTKDLQKTVYDALIAATGNKGNRASPLASANLHECREPKMPAVLVECGFMDNAIDAPLILSAGYAVKLADGLTAAIVKKGDLKKKAVVAPTKPVEPVKPAPAPVTSPAPKPAVTLRVGDKVKATGTHYTTGQKIPAFVKLSTLYVRQIGNGKVLVSRAKTGTSYTGWIKSNELRKV